MLTITSPLPYAIAYFAVGVAVLALHPRLRGSVAELWRVEATGAEALLKPFLCLLASLLSCAIWPIALFNAQKPPPKTALDQVQELGGRLIVGGYRRIYAQRQLGASEEMPDTLILDIYRRVGSAFRTVSTERRELLPSTTLSTIVLFFLETYRTTGAEFFDTHLERELARYREHGLGEDYQRPTKLF